MKKQYKKQMQSDYRHSPNLILDFLTPSKLEVGVMRAKDVVCSTSCDYETIRRIKNERKTSI